MQAEPSSNLEPGINSTLNSADEIAIPWVYSNLDSVKYKNESAPIVNSCSPEERGSSATLPLSEHTVFIGN